MEQPTEIPRGYLYWLKAAAKMPIPLRSDWRGVGKLVCDATKAVAYALLITAARVAVLATLPVSAPVFAIVAVKLNRRSCERLNQRRAELRDAFAGRATRARAQAQNKETK